MDRNYFITGRAGDPARHLNDGRSYVNRPMLVPFEPRLLTSCEPVVLDMAIGGDPAAGDPAPELNVYVGMAGDIRDDLRVKLNGTLLDTPRSGDAGLWYPVSPALLNRGGNRFVLSLPEEDPAGAERDWLASYTGAELARYPARVPWRNPMKTRLIQSEERGESLFLADEGAGPLDMSILVYPWMAKPGDEIVTEVRVAVKASDDPLAVCVRVADGSAVEILTLEPDRIGLYFAGLSHPMDATLPRTYRIETEGRNIRVLADGELILNGAGAFTTSADDRSHWAPLEYELEDWNRRSLLIGSVSGPGTGAAVWDLVRFRTGTRGLLLQDLLMTLRWQE